MSDVVLIHSTGQGAAGWQRVVRALDERGHRGIAIELPNDRPELRSADYAELVRRQAGDVSRPLVVAHSGSGSLLPAAALAIDARHQVWLAAWVPIATATFLEEVAEHRDEAFEPGWVGKDPIADSEVAREFLYHDCDEETLAWALSTRRPFVPDAVYDERIDPDNGLPSTYIVATEDRTIRPEWQRRMARERLGVEPLEIESGHCPNVSQPDRLAELLDAAA